MEKAPSWYVSVTEVVAGVAPVAAVKVMTMPCSVSRVNSTFWTSKLASTLAGRPERVGRSVRLEVPVLLKPKAMSVDEPGTTNTRSSLGGSHVMPSTSSRFKSTESVAVWPLYVLEKTCVRMPDRSTSPLVFTVHVPTSPAATVTPEAETNTVVKPGASSTSRKKVASSLPWLERRIS